MTRPPATRPLLEELEPRILYGADFAAVAAAGTSLHDAEVRQQAWVSPEPAQQNAAREIAIVDLALPDARTLVAGLQAQRDAGRAIDIVTIEDGADGLAVISQALEGRTDIGALHVLSHGTDGVVALGSTSLDAATLLARAAEIARWGDSLHAEADLLIYGCDVAASASGLALMRGLAALTGADVAASDDATGAAALGGDWHLEQQVGNLNTAVALPEAYQQAWSGVLGNSAPSNGLPGAASVVQDTSLTFTTEGGNAITISDAEAGTQPIRLDLSATNGVLSLQPTVGPEFQVNTTIASHQQQARIAVAVDGHYVVTWQSNNQDGSKFGIYARVFNADGSARTGEIAVNTTTSDQQSDPSIAIDASGRFVIAWQSYDTGKLTHDVYARSFNDDGTALSSQKRITSDADDQVLAAVAMDAAGNVLIAYQSKGQDSGTTQGIYARTADTALSSINAEFRVNTTTALDQAAPHAAASDAGFVVVWQSAGQDGSGTGIYAQRLSTAGTTLGGEVRVNVTTALDQSAPSVAMSADGRYVVVWQSATQDGSGAGIYAQRYDAAGAAQGGEFLVNTRTVGDQTAAQVALAADGRFTVAWTSKGQDDADGLEGVYAQGFAADGTRLGGEFRLNTRTAGVQALPSIGLRGDGGLLSVWHSNNQDGNGYGVFGQRFLAAGALGFLVGDGVDDAAISVIGMQSDLNAALQTLRFVPTASYWGPAGLTVTTDDLGAGGGPPMSDTDVLPIQVLKINVGPANGVPAAQSTPEDTPIVFSAALGNAITVADVDADPLPVQVSLSVTKGTLRLASMAGLTVVGGADGSAALTVQGRIASLNTALDGLLYTPTTNSTGADVLTLVSNDLGHSDVGGPYSATSYVNLTVATVNDAPAIMLPALATTPEGTTLVLSTANGNVLQIADPDAGVGNMEVTLVSTLGEIKLARTNNLSFVVGDGRGGEQRITFRGTLANINLALDGLQFTPLSAYAGPAWLEVATSDLGNSGPGGPLADRAVLEITIQPDANNARPVITVPGTQSTPEESALVLSVAAGNAISVLDDAGGQPLQVTLTLDSGTLTLGTSTGTEFQVATAVASDQQAAAVATTPTGVNVVVWQSNNQDGSSHGIFMQRFTADGFALGPEQRVNTTTAAAQTAPSLALADDGSFVVVWTSDGQDGGGGGGTGIFGQRFDAAGARLGAEFRINTTLADDQSAPTVARDASGNFVVVWQSKDQDGDGWGVYGRRFNAAGAALGAEFRVNSITAKDQSAPVVTMAASGSFVVAWQGVRPGGNDLSVYAQRFDASGAALGGEIAVNTVTYKDQLAPSIASDDAGNFVIAWQSQDIDYNDGKFGIYAQRYAADGTPQGVQFLVNTMRPDEQTAPAVTMDGSGNFVIAWQSKKQDAPDDKTGIYAQRFAAGGARVGGEFLVNTATADAQTAPSLALSDDGRLTVVWTSDGQDGSGLGVFGQRFIDARSLVFSVGDGIDDASMIFTGTPAQINDVLDGLMFTPAQDFDGRATLDITVDDLGHSGSGGAKIGTKSLSFDVLPFNDAPVISLPGAQTFTEDAPIEFSAAAGRAITVSDADAGTGKLLVTLSAPVGKLTLGALNGLQFTVGDGVADGTMSFTGTLVQLNNALNGLRLALPSHYTGAAAVNLTVNDQGNVGSGGALGTSATVTIAVLPGPLNHAPRVLVPGPQRTAVDTPLVLAAKTSGAVTVIDDAGSTPVRATVTVLNGTATLSGRIGAETTINATTTAGAQEEPRIAMLPSGNHIVVWTSDYALTGSDEVKGQRFDANGARVGPEFFVNSHTAGNQSAPALAANDSGAFVVAWVSENQDGNGRGIYVQRFGSQGQRLGTEMRVNTTITGDQTAPSVAIDASGAFVVAWMSADADGQGVFAQRFDANGQAAGGEFQLSASSADDQRVPVVAMDAAGNFVAVWQGKDAHEEGIFARRFDAAGNALGTEFVANAVTAESQRAPAVAMNASGAWIVSWQSEGIGHDILAQRFDASGTPIGPAFQVNSITDDDQTAPSVAINAGGEFAIVWQSKDSAGQGICAQLFAADGTPVGREQQVNTRTAGDQIAPSVGIAADGRYRVVWTGDNQDASNTGIAGQRMLRGDELSFITGNGIDDASFSFDATLADLNAALDGLLFTPTVAFVGIAQVQVGIDDLGATGGGAQAANGAVSIVVGNGPLVDLDLDDSSGAGGADFRINFRTGLGPVPVADSDAALSDPNSGNLQGLTVRIENLLDGAAEALAANTAGTAIVASYNSGTATLTLSGSASLANYQKVLRTITYSNAAPTPAPTERTVSFVAFDGSGYSNTAIATVSLNGALDSPPTAGDDVYATNESQLLSIGPGGVLVNDDDPDFDPLSSLLVSGPGSGVLSSFGADGSFTYVPNGGFSGLDSFTYRASAGGLFSDVATVTIIVNAVNEAPQGTNARLSIAEDTSHVFGRADFGFADPADTPPNDLLSVLIAVLPANGVLALNGTAVNAGDEVTASDIDAGRLVYTPTANANGTGYAQIGFQVRDDGGTSNGGNDSDPVVRWLTIDVAPVNDPPTAGTPVNDLTATEGSPFVYTLPVGSWLEADAADTLSFAATLDDGSPLPAWLGFLPGTQTFSGTPGNGDVGTITLKVVATDGSGSSAVQVFQLIVVNINDDPTVAAPIANQIATEGMPFALAFAGGTFTDIDAGDTLTYASQLSDGNPLPGWLSFDAGTRRFSGTPGSSDLGTLTVRVTATDTANASVSTHFTLVVNPINNAPTRVALIDDQAATEDLPFSFSVDAGTFSDSDAGDTLTYTATRADTSGLPAWLAFDGSSRTFSGTPLITDVGSLTVRVTATDRAGASVSDDFELAVSNANDPPRFTSYAGAASATVETFENTSAAASLQAVDEDASTTLRFAIAGGADAAAFRIDSASGQLDFVALPDRELPVDVDGDSRYELNISVTDGQLTAFQALSIVVLDINEPPIVQGHSLAIADAGVTWTLRTSDVDTAARLLVYEVQAVVAGQFERIGATGALLTFTQADIDAGQVAFVPDGSGTLPDYRLMLTDGLSRLTIRAPAVDDTRVPPAPGEPSGGAATPAAPTTPTAPSTPSTPATPTAPTAPTAPAAPTAPSTPSTPSTPATPTTPATPATPAAPTAPTAPTAPSTPSTPSTPATPTTPATPATPAAPTTPSTPTTPGTPSTPSTPGTVGTTTTPTTPTTPATEAASADPFGTTRFSKLYHTIDPSHMAGVFQPGVAIGASARAPAVAAALAPTPASVADSAALDALTRMDGTGTAAQAPTLLRTQLPAQAPPSHSADPTRVELAGGRWLEGVADELAAAVRSAGLEYEWWTTQGSRAYSEQLDRVRQEVSGLADSETLLVGGAGAVATTLSAGYVLWLVRGGVLLASVMSSVPAWAAVDPLPILAQMRRADDADGDDDVESIDPIEELFGRARRLLAKAAETAPVQPDPAPGLPPGSIGHPSTA